MEQREEAPGAVKPIVAEFEQRDQADRTVEALTKSGFDTDQMSIVARGAGEHDGRFQPGVLMLTVRAGRREADALRIIRGAGPKVVRHGLVDVTGDVHEESEAEEPAAT